MKYFLLTFLLTIAVGFALAAEARTYADRTLSWTCPATRTDGSDFACATDAAGYDLEVTKGATVTTVELAATATSRVITGDPAGTQYRIRVCDLAGECSAWSAPAKKPAAPSASSLTVK